MNNSNFTKNILLLTISFSAIAAHAAAIKWDGGAGGTGDTWGTAANWVGDALPGNADDAVFDNSSVNIPSLLKINASVGVGGVQFLQGLNAGNAVTVGNGGASAATLFITSLSPNPILTNGTTSGTIAFDKRVSGGTVDLVIMLTNSGSLNVANSGATTVISNIIGGGSLTLRKTGAGRLALMGANTNTSTLAISNGIVEIAADSGLGAVPGSATAAKLVLDGGTIRSINPGSGSTFISGNRGIAVGPNGATIDITNSGAILIYSGGQFTGTGTTLTKAGAGTLRLTTPTGVAFTKLVVNGGLYQANTDLSFGAVPGSFLSDAITLNNGAGISVNAGITLNANRGITVNAGGGEINTSSSLTYAGLILGSGAVTKSGASSLSLTSSNSFTGGLTMTAGSILIGNNSALGTGKFTVTGGTKFSSTTGSTRTFSNPVDVSGDITWGDVNNAGNLNFNTGAWTLKSGNRTITVDTNCTVAISSPIGEDSAGRQLIKGSGAPGILTLAATNTFTGGIAQNGGRINYNNSFCAGTGTITVGSGATEFVSTAAGVTLTNSIVLSAGANPLFYATSGNNLTNTGVISGSGALTRDDNGSGTVVLAGANTFSGGFKIISRTVQIGNSRGFGTGTLTLGDTVTAPATAINVTPTLTLTGANAVTNPVTINRDFTIGGTSTIEFSNSVTLAANATVTVTSGSQQGTISGAIGGSFGLIKAGSGILALNQVNTYTGGTTNSAGNISFNATGTCGDGTGTLLLSGGNILSKNTRSGVNISNPIVMTANATIWGDSTSANSARILPFSGTLSGTSGTTLTISNSGIATTTFRVDLVGSGFSFPGPINFSSATVGALTELAFLNASGDQTFTGIISGSGALRRTSGGRTILTAANTYTGNTAINLGTLVLSGSGSIAGSPYITNNASLDVSGVTGGSYSLASGQTLMGNGGVNGTIVVASGATVAPGSSIGTIYFTNAPTLSGTTSMEIDRGASPNADKLVVVTGGGTLNYGGTLTVVNNGATLQLNDTFDLFDADSFGGSFTLNLPSLPTGLAWDTSTLTTDGTIKVVCSGTLVANAGPDVTICPGGSTTIGGSPTASAGSGSYSYSWTPTAGLVDSTVANPTATNTGTYTVTVIDSVGCSNNDSVVVSTRTAPGIAAQPSSATVCAGSTATFSVTPTGEVLTYSWRKRGGGWGTGNAWSFSNSGGSLFFASSTDNDNGDTASNGGNDINSGNGKAWAIYNNGGVSDAVRNFPALSVGQTFSIDMDNGNIQNGGTVGIGLQNSSGGNRLEVYFAGGDSNYTINDGSANDSTIGFTRTGINIRVRLTGTDTYSVTITRYSDGATATRTGTLNGTGGSGVSRVRLFNANAGDCGFGCNNFIVYFNNLAAGAYDDNAGNYTAWNDSDNFGNKPLSDGGNVSGSTTATLTIGSVSASDVGSYDVSIYNCVGQTNSTSATLTVNARPTAVASGDVTICNGGSTMIQAALTGTGPWNVAWSDGVTQSGVSSSPATRSVSPSSSTVYTVTNLTDANCTALPGDLTGSATITVNARPTAVASGNATICNGGSTMIQAALTGTGPWDVAWSDGVIQSGVSSSPATRSVSPGSSTVYTITNLTDANCTALAGDLTGNATVTVNARPTSAVSGTATICNGSSTMIQAALTGTGPWNVAWSDGVTQSGVASSPATRSISPGSTTSYTVTNLTDANCTALAGDLTGSATVTVNARPTAAVSGNVTICNGSSTMIQAALTGSGPWDVTWSDGVTQSGVSSSPSTRSVSPSSTTTYTVTNLTDANCTALPGDLTGSAVVTVDPTSVGGTATPGASSVCSNGNSGTTITLSGHTGVIVEWQSSSDNFATETNHIASTDNPYSTGALTNTTFFRAVVQSGSCAATNSSVATVVVDSPSVGGTTTPTSATVCNGNGTTITLSGHTGSIVEWQSSSDNFATETNHINSTSNPFNTGNLSATTYFRAVVQSGACASDISSAATVSVTASPTAAVTGDATICNGSATMIQAALTGTSPWNVVWSDGFIQSGVSSSPATRSVSPSSTTIYTVTNLSDAACSAQPADLTGSATVTVNPTSAGGTATPALAAVCNGSGTAIALSNEVGAIVEWQSSSDNFATETNHINSTDNPFNTSNLTATTYFRAVVQSGVCAPANSTVATVNVNARPTAVASGNATICNGSSTMIQAALTGTGPWNVAWSDGVTQSGVSSSPATRSVSPTSTTIYTVTNLTDANCTALAGDLTGSATVTVNARPTAAVSGSATICNGSSTMIQAALTGAGPWNVTWSDGVTQSGVSSSPATRSVSPTSTTTYSVTNLTDANCTAQTGDMTGNAVITVNPRPTSLVIGTATICNGSSTMIQAALTGTGPWNVAWSDGVTQTGVSSSPASRSVSPTSTTTYTVTNLTDANCTAQAGDRTGSAIVTVDPQSVGGTATPADSTVCTGTGTTVGLSGHTGNIVKWQSSSDNFVNNTNDIASTANPLVTGPLTATTSFRAVVQSGVCSAADSSATTVTVTASAGGTAQAANSQVLSGNSTTITLSGYNGTIQWQSRTGTNAFANISGATNAVLNSGVLVTTTDFRATVTLGSCSSSNSTVATVEVYEVDPAQNIVEITTDLNGNVALVGAGVPGQQYVLQLATNLLHPAFWQSISTNTAGLDGKWNYTDTQTTNGNRRFYRSAKP